MRQKATPRPAGTGGASGIAIKIRGADRTPTPDEIQRAGAALSALARMLAHEDDSLLEIGGAQ